MWLLALMNRLCTRSSHNLKMLVTNAHQILDLNDSKDFAGKPIFQRLGLRNAVNQYLFWMRLSGGLWLCEICRVCILQKKMLAVSIGVRC